MKAQLFLCSKCSYKDDSLYMCINPGASSSWDEYVTKHKSEQMQNIWLEQMLSQSRNEKTISLCGFLYWNNDSFLKIGCLHMWSSFKLVEKNRNTVIYEHWDALSLWKDL